MTTEPQVRVVCSFYRCNRPMTREVGLTRTIPLCDQHEPHGASWGRIGMCSECQGALGLFHWHTSVASGFDEAVCCSCRKCPESQIDTTTHQAIDWALFSRLGKEQTAADPVARQEPKPAIPSPTTEVKEVEDGRFVRASGTGATIHAVASHDPLEAVCGTRTVRKATSPLFYDVVPEEYGLCWKCAKGG